MLELVPRRISSRRYEVRRDGEPVAEISLSWFREAGTLHIDGVAHELSRTGLGFGAFTLTRGGAPVARAHKPSAFRNRFEVEHEGRVYEVMKASWWGRRFAVRTDGRAIGSIGPHHPFTRRSEIVLPAELGLPVTVFLAALVVLLWNRDASAAGAGAS